MSAETSNRIALNISAAMLTSPATVPETIINELRWGLGGGGGGYLFLNRGIEDKLECIYSSDRKFYTVGMGYKIDDLPNTEQMDIFYRNDLIGIVSFEAQHAFEHETYEELVNNVICLALLKQRGASGNGTFHFFENSVYKELSEVLRAMLRLVNDVTGHVNASVQAVYEHNGALEKFKRQARQLLGNALNVVCDALDYVDYQGPSIIIKASDVDLVKLTKSAMKRLDILCPLTTSAGENVTASTDAGRVEQALIGVLRAVHSSLASVEVVSGEDLVEIVIHLKTNLRILEDPPVDHRDLGIHLSQMVCRHLGGDLSKRGPQLTLTFRRNML